MLHYSNSLSRLGRTTVSIIPIIPFPTCTSCNSFLRLLIEFSESANLSTYGPKQAK